MTRTTGSPSFRFPGATAVAPNLDRADEAALRTRLREQDEAACRLFVVTYGAQMLAVAGRILRDADATTEVVQDAFRIAFEGLATLDGSASLSRWVHRITLHAALAKWRAGRRRVPVNPALLEGALPRFDPSGHFREAPLPWSDLPELAVPRGQLHQKVREAIQRLPDNYRVALVLRDIEELPFDEVAELLDVTEGTARVHVHRARQALRTLLVPELTLC